MQRKKYVYALLFDFYTENSFSEGCELQQLSVGWKNWNWKFHYLMLSPGIRYVCTYLRKLWRCKKDRTYFFCKNIIIDAIYY